MMYNDKIGYGPTVSDALTGLFGPGASAAATEIAPTDGGVPASPPRKPEPSAGPPAAVPAVPGTPSEGAPSAALSPAKAAALHEVQSAISAAREAQKKGDFAEFGAALQRLDDAIDKFNEAK